MEILTSILEEHEDLYVSLACTGRLLAHGAPAVVEEVAETFEELKKRNPAELAGLIDLLPENPFVALLRAKPPEAFAKVERQISIAVLVTAHAFFESVIKELLQLAILCDRQKWLAELSGKTVTIGDVQPAARVSGIRLHSAPVCLPSIYSQPFGGIVRVEGTPLLAFQSATHQVSPLGAL